MSFRLNLYLLAISLSSIVLPFYPSLAQNYNYSPDFNNNPANSPEPTGYQDPFKANNNDNSSFSGNYSPAGQTVPFTGQYNSPPSASYSQNSSSQAQQPQPKNTPPTAHNRAIDLTNEAYALSKAGNNERAIELLKEAISLNPDSAVAHLDMSVALIALKRYNEALTESEIELRLNPNEEKGYLNYLAAAIGANHMQDALRVGQEYLARFPNGENRTVLSNEMLAVSQEMDRRAKTHGIMPPPGSPDNYLFFVTPYGKRRWQASFMPLKVFIYSGQNCRGFSPSYQSILINSFMTWQNLSQGLMRFVPVSDPLQANIECRWTDSAADLKFRAEAGDTQLFAKNGIIYHARITLLTCRSDAPDKSPSASLMRQVCLHEIGHALGIDGHSDNAQDIMYCATDPNVEHAELTQRDINTLFLIYL